MYLVKKEGAQRVLFLNNKKTCIGQILSFFIFFVLFEFSLFYLSRIAVVAALRHFSMSFSQVLADQMREIKKREAVG